MTLSLLYKEWKKTKWFVLGILIVGLFIQVYMFLKLGRSLRMVGEEHIWNVIINRNQFLFTQFKFFPVISGLVLGLAQFVPEIIQKRIKLSLHLPMKENAIIFTMLGYGQVVLLINFILLLSVFLIGISFVFPWQIILSTIQTVIPWFAAGLVVNSLVAWISIEPTWKYRFVDVLISLAVLYVFFISSFPGAYAKVIWLILLLIVYVMPFVMWSVHRFKVGKQD